MPQNADRAVAAAMAREDPARLPSDPRGVRNRSPGNIRAGVGFKGEIGADADGYARFDTDHNGIRAIGVDLLTKYRRGLVSVRAIVSVYAPSSENDTEAYIRAVCNETGVLDYALLHLYELRYLVPMVTAVIRHECGGVDRWYTADQIAAACADALHASRPNEPPPKRGA